MKSLLAGMKSIKVPEDPEVMLRGIYTFDIGRVFHCSRCDWYRELGLGADFRAGYLHHPVYGTHTRLRIARLDIFYHDCYEHGQSQKRLVNYGVKERVYA